MDSSRGSYEDLSGLQTENKLSGWNKILGETSLSYDCQIWFFKIMNFSKQLVQFLGLCSYFKPKNNSSFLDNALLYENNGFLNF